MQTGDRGTLGAAAFAAAGFIQDQKSSGLKRLTGCLLPLGSASQVKVEGTTVAVGTPPLINLKGDNGEDLDFATFALTEHDLIDFMNEDAAKWGYYQSKDKTFIRWVVR
ncbi:MAG TPA: hypothetical protein PLR37_02205 [Candidatus Accumulibacter phosphatis]|nr:hypothetical protein [Candidatus Accumulibacter phosphatis]